MIDIPFHTNDQTIIKETYTIDDFSGKANLEVETIYKDGKAESQRSYFKNTSKNDIQQSYLDFYANIYPQIDTLELLSYSDNTKNNEFRVVEHYRLDNIWEAADSLKPNDVSTYFYARSLYTFLTRDNHQARKSPMALSYPTNFDQTIVVNLPIKWSLENESESISGPGFEYKSTVDYKDKTLTLNYHYETNRAHIEKEEYREFMEKNEKITDQLSYGLVHFGDTSKDTAGGGFNSFILIIGVLVLAIGIMFARKLYFYDPIVDSFYRNSRMAIGGWLVLPVIGLALTPIRMTYSLFSGDYFDLDAWSRLFNPNSPYYSPSYSMFILVEFSVNILFILFAVLNNILLYTRRSSFPKMMMAFYILNFVFIALDAIVANILGNDVTSSVGSEVIKSFVGVAIWVPYFFMSERVKKTFTKQLKPIDVIEEEQETEEQNDIARETV